MLFPSLGADFTIHIISIFLIDQPLIHFEPRLENLCSLDFACADPSFAVASSFSIAVAVSCSSR